MILSHHGEMEFGSPVVPKIPEAFLLHHIDNMDAKMEMVRMAYLNNPATPDGLVDSGFPLKRTLISPLARQFPE